MISEHIGVENQLRGLHVLHFDRPGNTDACVVDQHVQPVSDLAFGLAYGLVDFVLLQHIEAKHADIDIFVAGQLPKLVCLGARDVPHCRVDCCAEPGKMFGCKPSEPGRRSGNKNRFSGKVGTGFHDVGLRACCRSCQCAGRGGSGEQGATR